MNIIHIWDQAGVACTLAKYQRLQGHRSKVIMSRGFDKFGIYRFYKDIVDEVAREKFTSRSIEACESADIIHVHSYENILLQLRKKFGQSKKIILQYHGSDIRGVNTVKSLTPKNLAKDLVLSSKKFALRMSGKLKSPEQMHSDAQKAANRVILSTPDLLPLVTKGIYLNNPVDIEHFTPDKFPSSAQREVLTINTEAADTNLTLQYCKSHGVNIDIEVYDRTKNPLMFGDMPSFLKKYRVYVDIKYVNNMILESFSKTGLEALACGLKVLNYQLKYHQGLPPEHNPTSVVARLMKIYSS